MYETLLDNNVSRETIRSDYMKTLFEYIAGILTLIICSAGITLLGALLVALSPIIGIFIIANDD